uniref:(California timema) hypothetical protein n=1 Tax=Timema californicum TaxID=61474 RepID=A0A7R9PBM5_TIMCA|nr:unnamed protein product [Timema californicum]
MGCIEISGRKEKTQREVWEEEGFVPSAPGLFTLQLHPARSRTKSLPYLLGYIFLEQLPPFHDPERLLSTDVSRQNTEEREMGGGRGGSARKQMRGKCERNAVAAINARTDIFLYQLRFPALNTSLISNDSPDFPATRRRRLSIRCRRSRFVQRGTAGLVSSPDSPEPLSLSSEVEGASPVDQSLDSGFKIERKGWRKLSNSGVCVPGGGVADTFKIPFISFSLSSSLLSLQGEEGSAGTDLRESGSLVDVLCLTASCTSSDVTGCVANLLPSSLRSRNLAARRVGSLRDFASSAESFICSSSWLKRDAFATTLLLLERPLPFSSESSLSHSMALAVSTASTSPSTFSALDKRLFSLAGLNTSELCVSDLTELGTAPVEGGDTSRKKLSMLRILSATESLRSARVPSGDLGRSRSIFADFELRTFPLSSPSKFGGWLYSKDLLLLSIVVSSLSAAAELDLTTPTMEAVPKLAISGEQLLRLMTSDSSRLARFFSIPCFLLRLEVGSITLGEKVTGEEDTASSLERLVGVSRPVSMQVALAGVRDGPQGVGRGRNCVK